MNYSPVSTESVCIFTVIISSINPTGTPVSIIKSFLIPNSNWGWYMEKVESYELKTHLSPKTFFIEFFLHDIVMWVLYAITDA